MLKDKNILIIGLGLMGGSYAYNLSKLGYNVFGYDYDEETLKYAYNKKYIKHILPLEEVIKQSDLIIFALYPNDIVYYLKKYQHLFKDDVLLTDISGVKSNLLKEVKTIINDKFTYISHHPMSGREKVGIKYCEEVKFNHANFLIIDDEHNARINEILELGKVLNFKHIEVVSSKFHDEVIAYLSQLSHVLAMSLMLARENEHMVNYSGDSFIELTRIAKINENLWSKLFLENKELLLEEINNFFVALEKIKKCLETDNEDELKKLMKLSSLRREKFDE